MSVKKFPIVLLLPFVASIGAMLDGIVNHEATDAFANRIIGMVAFTLWTGLMILADMGHKEREELDVLIWD